MIKRFFSLWLFVGLIFCPPPPKAEAITMTAAAVTALVVACAGGAAAYLRSGRDVREFVRYLMAARGSKNKELASRLRAVLKVHPGDWRLFEILVTNGMIQDADLGSGWIGT